MDALVSTLVGVNLLWFITTAIHLLELLGTVHIAHKRFLKYSIFAPLAQLAFIVMCINEKRDPKDHTLSFLKVILGLVATFTNDLLRIGVCKGMFGMRNKLGRQETRMVLGVSAFSAMASLTWLTGKRDNLSELPYLLPLTFFLIIGLYALISSVRISRKVKRIRKRLEGTIEPLEGNWELQERQKQMLEKYKRWESACKGNTRIVSFILFLELAVGCTVLSLKSLRQLDELVMLNPSRFLFYSYVMLFWKRKMFPIQ